MKAPSWQTTILVCFLTSAVLLVSVWLIHENRAPPSFLLVPIGALFTGATGLAVGYMHGLIKLPPYLEGAEIETRIVKTLPPPPTVAELLGTAPAAATATTTTTTTTTETPLTAEVPHDPP